jgi:hypothetical protein
VRLERRAAVTEQVVGGCRDFVFDNDGNNCQCRAGSISAGYAGR